MKKINKHKQIKKQANKGVGRSVFYLAGILFILSLILYFNTLWNKYTLDDFSVIKENWVVKSGVKSIPLILKTSYRFGYWNSAENLYRPISLILFAILWQISPDNPAFYHFITILLFAFTGFFLFITLEKVMKKISKALLFFSVLLFLFHPIHSEVVANIKSCDELLSFLFLIFTINFLWKYLENNSFKYFLGSLGFYFLAFLSKESAITFLAVIPLLIYFFTDIPLKKNFGLSFVFIIPALIFLAIRQSVLGEMLKLDVVSLIDNLLLATPDHLLRLATAIKILGIYFWKIFFPYPLVADSSFNQITIVGFTSFQALLPLVLYIGLFVLAILNFKKKSLISFSILFFLITISIYSNVIMIIGSCYGERFLFVPVLGFCLIIPFFLFILFKKDIYDKSIVKPGELIMKNKGVLMILLPILLIYSFMTIIRSSEWENDTSLYSADVKKSPNSAHMRYYYGLVLMKDKIADITDENVKQRFLDLAIDEFKAAIHIYPNYADAWDQMGLAYFKKGDKVTAIKCYESAIKFNPTKAITYSNMGVIYFNSGDYLKALELYQKAVYYFPRYADGYQNLGSTYGTLGKYDLAIQSFKKSLEFNPDNAMVYYFLGITYKSIGDQANSMKYLTIAHKMEPKIKTD